MDYYRQSIKLFLRGQGIDPDDPSPQDLIDLAIPPEQHQSRSEISPDEITDHQMDPLWLALTGNDDRR